jgi:hypothetical protein
VTVNDLTGIGVTGVAVDLAGALGGTAGDGAADRVVVNGTAGNDAPLAIWSALARPRLSKSGRGARGSLRLDSARVRT